MDTAALNGDQPMNHLLQALHTISANLAFSTVRIDENIRNWKVSLAF